MKLTESIMNKINSTLKEGYFTDEELYNIEMAAEDANADLGSLESEDGFFKVDLTDVAGGNILLVFQGSSSDEDMLNGIINSLGTRAIDIVEMYGFGAADEWDIMDDTIVTSLRFGE